MFDKECAYIYSVEEKLLCSTVWHH